MNSSSSIKRKPIAARRGEITMTEEEFREKLRERGYGDPQIEEAGPGPVKDMHTHDQSVMWLVLSGELTMMLEGASTTYRPGDWCENVAGTLHTERMGPEGVTVLLARK
jgi:mannose-6-phosphate isomerase-like protein (cupin superfamily)